MRLQASPPRFFVPTSSLVPVFGTCSHGPRRAAENCGHGFGPLGFPLAAKLVQYWSRSLAIFMSSGVGVA